VWAPRAGRSPPLPRDAAFVELAVPPDAAPTFHGRDVFAPAAARLALGEALAALGPAVTDAFYSPLPVPRWDGVAWSGEVIYVDRFGTLVTNLPGDAIEPGVRLRVGATEVGGLRRTFGDVERGTLLAFIGSGGTVEIAVRDGSAARLLGVGVGVEVRA
jgi:S-adenosylmethionine hydrolase